MMHVKDKKYEQKIVLKESRNVHNFEKVNFGRIRVNVVTANGNNVKSVFVDFHECDFYVFVINVFNVDEIVVDPGHAHNVASSSEITHKSWSWK
jgi:hypothetical protein